MTHLINPTMRQFILLLLTSAFSLSASAQEWKIVERGFLYDNDVPPTCHAATLVEADNGDIIASFFGGTYEGHPDSDVWMCRFVQKKKQWTAPEILADGVLTRYTRSAFDYDPLLNEILNRNERFAKTTWLGLAKHSGEALISDKVRKPCYNPVLYIAQNGELVLDYKIGSNMQDWTGWEIRSKDGGKNWTHPRALTDDPEQRFLRLGPIKNKPIVNDGRIIAGSSTEITYDSWKVHFELSDDDGKNWYKSEVECDTILCIQPTILKLGDNHLKALCRTRHHRVAVTESKDNGTTWTPMRLTDMKHNNSGIDAVTLHDGTHLLIANDTDNDARRSPLTLFASSDGEKWKKIIDVEGDDGKEYSYPAIIETRNGDVWIIYTWHREKMAYVHLTR